MTDNLKWGVAGAVRKAAADLLAPKYAALTTQGGVSYKGPDLHCEDVRSLWVWPTSTRVVDGVDPCHKQRVTTFLVLVAFNSCTEKIEPCDKAVYAHPDGSTGCEPPDPLIFDGICGPNKPTVAQETAAFFEISDILERKLACAAMKQAESCDTMHCNTQGAIVRDSTYGVEGAVASIELTLEITW